MESNAISAFWQMDHLLLYLSDHVTVKMGTIYGMAEVCADRPRHQRVDKSNIEALCRVNKACQRVFTPILFRHILLRNWPRALPMMRLLAENPWVAHTRTLIVWSCRWDSPHDEAASRLIQCLSSLQRFHWHNEQLIESSTVAALVGSCGNLAALRIDFPTCEVDRADLSPDDPLVQRSSAQITGVITHLGNLTRLRELALTRMPGHPDQWINPISQILIASPRLQELTLSMAGHAVAHRDGDLTPFKTFLHRICTLYKASGRAPLRLRSFRCGTGVYPDFPPGSHATITDLISLDALETVYLNTNVGISTRRQFPPVIGGTDRHVPIATFLHETPRVRSFAVSRYDAQVHDELARLDPARARRLAVAWDVLHVTGGIGPGALVKMAARPKLHFRMVKLHLHRLGSNDGSAGQGAVMQAQAILKGLIEGDEGTLEGLAVVLPVAGRKLYLELLVDAVRQLPGLRQVSVEHREDNWLHYQQHVVDDRSREEVANMLAVAGKALKYIKTDEGRKWGRVKVVRGEEVVKEDGAVVPLLLNIGVEEEAQDVELFELASFGCWVLPE